MLEEQSAVSPTSHNCPIKNLRQIFFLYIPEAISSNCSAKTIFLIVRFLNSSIKKIVFAEQNRSIKKIIFAEQFDEIASEIYRKKNCCSLGDKQSTSTGQQPCLVLYSPIIYSLTTCLTLLLTFSRVALWPLSPFYHSKIAV